MAKSLGSEPTRPTSGSAAPTALIPLPATPAENTFALHSCWPNNGTATMLIRFGKITYFEINSNSLTNILAQGTIGNLKLMKRKPMYADFNRWCSKRRTIRNSLISLEVPQEESIVCKYYCAITFLVYIQLFTVTDEL